MKWNINNNDNNPWGSGNNNNPWGSGGGNGPNKMDFEDSIKTANKKTSEFISSQWELGLPIKYLY